MNINAYESAGQSAESTSQDPIVLKNVDNRFSDGLQSEPAMPSENSVHKRNFTSNLNDPQQSEF